jgi:hypothetical protein
MELHNDALRVQREEARRPALRIEEVLGERRVVEDESSKTPMARKDGDDLRPRRLHCVRREIPPSLTLRRGVVDAQDSKYIDACCDGTQCRTDARMHVRADEGASAAHEAHGDPLRA